MGRRSHERGDNAARQWGIEQNVEKKMRQKRNRESEGDGEIPTL
jgi:hypothetical protein